MNNIKLSSAATRYCYALSFSKPYAYKELLAELFEGVNEEWMNPRERLERINTKGMGHFSMDDRRFGLNVKFNILYDFGANPTVNYVDGGWQHEEASREELYAYLANLDEVSPGKEEKFRHNADKRIVELKNGHFKYVTTTQMYVLGWDPNELKQT